MHHNHANETEEADGEQVVAGVRRVDKARDALEQFGRHYQLGQLDALLCFRRVHSLKHFCASMKVLLLKRTNRCTEGEAMTAWNKRPTRI